MPLPTISLTVRALVAGSIAGGGRWSNTWHFRKTSGAVDAAAINALASELVKLYGGPAYTGAGNAYYLQLCRSTTTADTMQVTPLDGVSASSFPSITAAGLASSAPLPPEIAEVLTFHTTLRGRSYRGRVYLPAWTIDQDSGGKMQATDIAHIIGNYTGFATALGTANWEHVVASYKHQTAQKVASVTMDPMFDSQRSRKT